MKHARPNEKTAANKRVNPPVHPVTGLAKHAPRPSVPRVTRIVM